MNATKSPFEIFLAYIMGEKKLFIIDTICAVLVAAIDLEIGRASCRERV